MAELNLLTRNSGYVEKLAQLGLSPEEGTQLFGTLTGFAPVSGQVTDRTIDDFFANLGSKDITRFRNIRPESIFRAASDPNASQILTKAGFNVDDVKRQSAQFAVAEQGGDVERYLRTNQSGPIRDYLEQNKQLSINQNLASRFAPVSQSQITDINPNIQTGSPNSPTSYQTQNLASQSSGQQNITIGGKQYLLGSQEATSALFSEAQRLGVSVPKVGTENYIQDLSNIFNGQTTPSSQMFGTSQSPRLANRKAEIERIKQELESGLIKPNTFNSLAEFDRLRKERGIVIDEKELQTIQNESALIQQELRQFSAFQGREVSEAGRIGTISEAEKNAQFRLEGLAIRENAVINRLNSKNAYISTALQLGQQDYNQARQEYEFEYNKNLRAIDLYNEELDEQKKDALTTFTTLSNLISEKGVSQITPQLRTQLETAALQAGLDTSVVDLMLTQGKDKINNVFSRDEGIFAVMEGADGIPYIKQLKGFGSNEFESGIVPGATLEQSNALKNAFNSAVLGLPASTQKKAANTFNQYLASGDIQGAKNYLLSVVTQGLPTEQQNQLVGRAVATDALKQIQILLGEARTKGASTNFFTGNLEYMAQKLGTSTDPDLAYIGSLMQQQFITYRRAMTGVAFSPGETEDYKKIFPSLIDVEKLSSAKIKSLTDTFELYNRANLSVYLGGQQNYNALYGEVNLNLPSNTVNSENQQSMESDYNQQIIETKPAGGGITNWLKGAWNLFTSPWLPKF